MTPRPRAVSPDATIRLDRVEHAMALGPSGVPVLLPMLADPSWSVRRRVVAALAAAGDVAVGPLVAVLRDERRDETRNAAAMDALALSTADADDAVLALADHPDPAVVADAARVLGRRRSRRAAAVLSRLTAAEDDNVALAAIEALGQLGGRGAVESLIALVKGGNFFRTFPAIDVLGRSGDPRAIAPLAALLHDARYGLEAMRALGRTGDRRAAGPLGAMLGHASPTVVRVAAVSIGELTRRHGERWAAEGLIEEGIAQAAPPAAVRALAAALSGASESEQQAIAHVLGMVRAPDAAAVLASLVDGPTAVARTAARAFERLGPSADEQIVELLRHGDSTRRAVVLPLVARRMDASAEIAACLDDPDGAVRALAAEALARTGAVDHLEAIFRLLADPNARVAQAAVGAIQALGDRRTEALTLEALAGDDARVRREALRLVRNFGWPSALPAVVSALADPDERIRDAAMMALPALEEPAADQALLAQASAEDPRTRAAAMRALGQGAGGTAARDALRAGAADSDAWVRYYAVQSLGKLRSADDAAVLQQAIDDVAGQVRVAAIEALARIPRDDAFRALERAAGSEEPDIRRAAVLGLGITGRSEALPIVLGALASPDGPTRLVAVSALGATAGAGKADALARAARDTDENVRLTAIGFLAEDMSLEATSALVALLLDAPERDRVRVALSAPSPGRIAGIRRAFEGADEELAAQLASALARMHTGDAVEALIATATSGHVVARRAAVTALGAVAGPDAVEALQRVARDDEDADVRRIAALAALPG